MNRARPDPTSASPPRPASHIDRLAVTIDLDPYLGLKALAAYSSLSVRKLRQYLTLPPDDALPSYRMGGKVLVRRSDFDGWMARYRRCGNQDVARVVDDVLAKLKPS